MEPFGKAAALILLAGCVALPFAGCNKAPAERFETYNELKKSSADQPAEPATAKKAEPAALLTSKAPPASETPGAAHQADSRNVAKTPSANPPATPKSPSVTSPPKIVTTSAAVPAEMPKIAPAGATSGPKPVYQASVASNVPGTSGASAPTAAKGGSARKVQVLVPNRTFKTEGPEGAWRVSYDDIDLLKVVNMDPVPPDAATKMPGWLKGLDGKRIRIRGYMYPTFQATGIHAFGLARDNQICCFGRNPKIYDLFDVLMRDGVTTNFLPGRPFDVVGVFHIRPEAEDGKLYHLYEIDDATVIAK